LPDSISQIAAAISAGSVRAVDVIAGTLARIEQHDPRVNAFTSITADRAMAQAAAIDRARAAGETLAPLAGVPFAVKNLFDLEGIVTVAGSKILADDPRPGATRRWWSGWWARAPIPVGALNMDEFAYGFTTENSHVGACRNPHDLGRMSGGSSGGSAAAVAAGLVPLTLGSDTNGSIRVPSSLCGVFGLKPTYGRLSRAGTYPFVGSFDHLGPFARSPRRSCAGL
jgi:amidase/aspartyl-tRNA(Asn)/glutamyl-tRNA(Gln) amidotransferase subunit A